MLIPQATASIERTMIFQVTMTPAAKSFVQPTPILQTKLVCQVTVIPLLVGAARYADTLIHKTTSIPQATMNILGAMFSQTTSILQAMLIPQATLISALKWVVQAASISQVPCSRSIAGGGAQSMLISQARVCIVRMVLRVTLTHAAESIVQATPIL